MTGSGTKWMRGVALACAALGLWRGTAAASWTKFVEVAQPLMWGDTGSESPVISRVTYATSGDAYVPALAVRFTCDSNSVRADGEVATNMNVASLAGLSIRVDRVPEWNQTVFVASPSGEPVAEAGGKRGFLVYDSVEVTLSIPGGHAPADSVELARADSVAAARTGCSLDEIVDATVECIRRNAAWGTGPPLRTLVIRIDGPVRFAKHAKTWTLWRPPPRVRGKSLL